MEHDFLTAADISDYNEWGQRNIIDGGLAVCKMCGLAEGSLTTDCPGKESFVAYNQDVYTGKLDYLESKGWVEQTSKHSPEYWTKERLEALRR